MTALLKQEGHNARLFSLDEWSSFNRLTERIVQFKPEILAYSVTASSFAPAVKISKRLRKKFPKIIQICGGVHTTLCPEDFYAAQSLDAICRGEGEYVLLDLIGRLKKKDNSWLQTSGFWTRKGKKIFKNPPADIIRNLEALPIPDREMFYREGILHFPRIGTIEHVQKHGLEFIFTRGCPFRCTYCSNHALHSFFGKWYVRRKSPEKSITEIINIMQTYHYDYFRFHDDTFTADHVWLHKFLNLYKKQIHVPFSCNIRVDTCSKELLAQMKDAGCYEVSIGIESGDQHIRSTVLKRPMSNGQIINVFRWSREIDLKTFAFIMIGFSEESPKNFHNTVKLTAEVDPDSYILYVFYPYPGTELFDICKNNNYILSQKPRGFKERLDTILNLPNFKRVDILYYYNHFDQLVNASKKSSHFLQKPYRKILYSILKVPPSYFIYPVTQFVYYCDRLVIRLLQILYPTYSKRYNLSKRIT